MDGLPVSHPVAHRNGLVLDLRCPQRRRVPIKDAGNVIFAFALDPLSLGDIIALHGSPSSDWKIPGQLFDHLSCAVLGKDEREPPEARMPQ
jgi:hypothetical protein